MIGDEQESALPRCLAHRVLYSRNPSGHHIDQPSRLGIHSSRNPSPDVIALLTPFLSHYQLSGNEPSVVTESAAVLGNFSLKGRLPTDR